jgi:hypothetical protein
LFIVLLRQNCIGLEHIGFLPYKSRHCVGNIAESFQDLGYSKLVRNFFESSHGNGPQDAAGGLLKNQADMVVVRGKAEIRCARDLYNFDEAKL